MYICEICGTKFSSDFTDESEAVLLIGLLTDLRGYLAAGQWLTPDMGCYCFWSRRFRRWRRFFFVGGVGPTDFTDLHRFFFVGLFLSHRFRRYTQIFYGISGESLCPIPGGICNDRTGRLCDIPWVIAAAGNIRINSVSSDDEKNLRHLRNLRDKKTSQEKSVYICEICGTKFSSDFTELWPLGQWLAPDMCCYCFWSRRFRRWRRFLFVGGFGPTDFTDLHRSFWISGESLCPIPGGICNDRTGRLCEIPWVIASARNLRINSVGRS